jgi:hypothetical protein
LFLTKERRDIDYVHLIEIFFTVTVFIEMD